MLPVILNSPKDIQDKLARKFRDLRVYRDLSRETLATMSGVPEPSIKRFELTGEISLKSMLRLAHALEAMDEFDHLFPLPVARSLDEIEKQDRQRNRLSRKRGRK